MRILVANKFWYVRGGLERTMFDEIAALESRGHEVAHFSTTHPKNVSSPWSDRFAPYVELGADDRPGAGERVAATLRLFHNGPAARAFQGLVESFSPDLVHVHGIHRQLSPSILGVAARAGVPVVHTLHDFHLVCPADYLLRGDGSVCLPRRCGTYWYGPAVGGRCMHGSLAKSTLSALETAFQRVRRIYERTVTRFVSPSAFLADLMRQAGWDRTPVDVVPNAAPIWARSEMGTYFLYAGRLSREKGVDVLVDAARAARVKLVIAGEGPLEMTDAGSDAYVEFLGRVDHERVLELLAGARAAVVPSVCADNAPLGVLEALGAGVPVVASRIGGIPEIVQDGVEGFLVEPGEAVSLAEAMTMLVEDEGLARRMGDAGRARADAEYSPDLHADRLLQTYGKAVAGA